jgi:hypothetical protein
MGDRGPIPKGAGAVVTLRIERIERIKPPADLAPEVLEVWHGVVSSMPADWFQAASAALLTQYCRHVVELDFLDQWLRAIKADPKFDAQAGAYARCLEMRDHEARAASSLATRLRLTPQSIYKGTAKRGPGIADRKPWDE